MLKKHEFLGKLSDAVTAFPEVFSSQTPENRTNGSKRRTAMLAAKGQNLRVHGQPEDEVVNAILDLYGNRNTILHTIAVSERAWSYYEHLELHGSVHLMNDK